MAEGIRKRHTKNCPARRGGRCRCDGSFQAYVYSPKDGRKIYKHFPPRIGSEVVAGRHEARPGSRQPAGTERKDAARSGDGVAGRRERGEFRNRSGQPFKPSTLRGYRQSLEDRLLPALGARKLNAITTSDLQALVNGWQAEGRSSAGIRNTIKPLQVIYRRARSREGVPNNPTRDLELPAPDHREVEIVAPGTAAKLLAAVPVDDRAIWATALYAGLRYGELRALRWRAVNMGKGVVEVRESWDPKVGSIEPKTRKSRRSVPLPSVLRRHLQARREAIGDPAEDSLVFAVRGDVPFEAEKLYRVADKAWVKAGISDRLRLHQARHTYASFMIAAGVNAKTLSAFMGHSSITVTFDLYGHLMPGAEVQGAALLDAFLSAQDGADEDRQ